MNNEERELFRIALLNVLEQRASDRFGLQLKAIQTFLGAEGFRGAGGSGILAELSYLEDKEFAARVGKQISPENACWRITAAGRDFLATNG